VEGAAASDAIPYLQIVGGSAFLVIELGPSCIESVNILSRLIQLSLSTVKLRSIAHDGGILKRRLAGVKFLLSFGDALLDTLELTSFFK